MDGPYGETRSKGCWDNMPNSTEAQIDLIRAALLTGRYLSPMDALRDFGCFRLAAVVHVLRKEGHKIATDMSNKYAVYSLSQGGEQLQLAGFSSPSV